MADRCVRPHKDLSAKKMCGCLWVTVHEVDEDRPSGMFTSVDLSEQRSRFGQV